MSVAELVRSQIPIPEQVDRARVFAWWVRAMPKQVVRHARPKHLKNGLLLVNCDSHVWAQELQLQSFDLLERLRRSGLELNIRELRFRVGPMDPIALTRPPPPEQPIVAPAELPPEMARALAGVHDDALRDVIAKAAGLSLARDARKRGQTE